MKVLTAVVLVLVVFSASTDAAWARWSSGRSASSGSGSSKKNVTGYAEKRCKTASCYKKHPSGEYAIPLHEKKVRQPA